MAQKQQKQDLIVRLRDWAVAGGAENQALTNPYELLRLRVVSGVAIVYRKETGRQTWNALADRLRIALLAGEQFPDELKITKIIKRSKVTSVTHLTLLERDGEGCFFCFEEKPGLMTIEHLVPRAHGGPNHISNKFRACGSCNVGAGHKSAPEKIRLREANLVTRIALQKETA